MKSIEPKLYAGIDYEFRPKSFWTAVSDPLAAILRNVKGRNRREMIRDYYEAGKLDQLSDRERNGYHMKKQRRGTQQPTGMIGAAA